MKLTFKELTADNAFDFCAVLDAVGVNHIIGVFDRKEIALLRKGGKNARAVGTVLAAKAAGVLMRYMSGAREPLYTFFAGCTVWDNGKAVTADDLRSLKLHEFIELIRDFAKQRDVLDFFRDVSELLGTERTASGNLPSDDTPQLTAT